MTDHKRSRWFVWDRNACGLRAFGIDFGPFALVVLLDSRREPRDD